MFEQLVNSLSCFVVGACAGAGVTMFCLRRSIRRAEDRGYKAGYVRGFKAALKIDAEVEETAAELPGLKTISPLFWNLPDPEERSGR